MKNILVSAMLQSQQAWLTEISLTLKSFAAFIDSLRQRSYEHQYIAHCDGR